MSKKRIKKNKIAKSLIVETLNLTSKEIKALEEIEKTREIPGEIKGFTNEELETLCGIGEMEKAGIIVINEIFD